MTKDDDAAVSIPAKVSNPVTLRLGELEPHVAVRLGNGAPGATVKRDLGRYYALLNDGLRQTHFTLPEAEAVVLALHGFDHASIRYLWAEVERQYLANDEDPDRPSFYMLPDDVDAAALVDKLRGLTLHQAVAVLDAVERYWANYPEDEYPEADTERLIEAGLVWKGVAENDEKRRKADRGKVIARDPAARLRRRHPESE